MNNLWTDYLTDVYNSRVAFAKKKIFTSNDVCVCVCVWEEDVKISIMHFYFEFPFMQPVLELCSFQVSRFSLEVHLSVLEFLFEYAQTFMS